VRNDSDLDGARIVKDQRCVVCAVCGMCGVCGVCGVCVCCVVCMVCVRTKNREEKGVGDWIGYIASWDSAFNKDVCYAPLCGIV